MTRDDAEDFLSGMNASLEGGELPELSNLTPDQKATLLRACSFIDTPEKRRAVAVLLDETKTEKGARAFSFVMMMGRAGLTIKDFITLMWSIPGAMLIIAIYILSGGEVETVADLARSLGIIK